MVKTMTVRLKKVRLGYWGWRERIERSPLLLQTETLELYENGLVLSLMLPVLVINFLNPHYFLWSNKLVWHIPLSQQSFD